MRPAWYSPLHQDGTSLLVAAAKICHHQVNIVFPSCYNSSPYLLRNEGSIL